MEKWLAPSPASQREGSPQLLIQHCFTSVLCTCNEILASLKTTSKLPLISSKIMAHWNDLITSGPKPNFQEGETISLHCYSKGMWAPQHFLHETEKFALLSASYLQTEGFWAFHELGGMHGKPMTDSAVACTGTRLSCLSQGTRNTYSAILILQSLFWSPISVCELADSRRASHCAVWRGCFLWNPWLPRSIWEMIQQKNITNVFSGNFTDCFRQQRSAYPFLLWPPLETHSILSLSFSCWWESPTEKKINSALKAIQSTLYYILISIASCSSKLDYVAGCVAE